MGLEPRTLGSRPEPKADALTTALPRRPSSHDLRASASLTTGKCCVKRRYTMGHQIEMNTERLAQLVVKPKGRGRQEAGPSAGRVGRGHVTVGDRVVPPRGQHLLSTPWEGGP